MLDSAACTAAICDYFDAECDVSCATARAGDVALTCHVETFVLDCHVDTCGADNVPEDSESAHPVTNVVPRWATAFDSVTAMRAMTTPNLVLPNNDAVDAASHVDGAATTTHADNAAGRHVLAGGEDDDKPTRAAMITFAASDDTIATGSDTTF